MRHLVFAVTGWCTMLFTPTVVEIDTDYSFSVSTSSGPLPIGQPRVTDAAMRQSFEQSSRQPIGALLRSYDLMPIACPPGYGSGTAGLSPPVDRAASEPLLLVTGGRCHRPLGRRPLSAL